VIRLLLLFVALVIASASAPVHAAPVESRASVPAPAGVVVDIWLGEIDLVVEGWTKPKVEMEAALRGKFTPRLEKDGDRVHVHFDGLGIPSGGTVTLRVPQGAELQVRTRGGDVQAKQLRGRISVASTSGDVAIAGAPTGVEVATVNGDVSLVGANGRAQIATVSGDVEVANARGELRVETVSGEVDVTRAKLGRLQAASVSGEVRIAGELGKGPHRVDTNSGEVRLTVPRTAALRIAASTFSGDIVDAFVEPRQSHERSHARELGKGGGLLEIMTFSGDVELRPAR